MSLRRARIVGEQRTVALLETDGDVRCWHCHGDGYCWCCWCGRPGGEHGARWESGLCVACWGTGFLIYPTRGSTNAQVGTSAPAPSESEKTKETTNNATASPDVCLRTEKPAERDLFGSAA